MSVSEWNNFTYYKVGDQVHNNSPLVYECILDNINQPPPDSVYWTPLSTGAGIASIQNLTNADNGGNVVLAPPEFYTSDPDTGTITLSLPQQTQYGFATQETTGTFPVEQTIPITSYGDGNVDYVVMIQLSSSESGATWSQITGKRPDAFTVQWYSDDTSERTINFQWLTVGATPVQ